MTNEERELIARFVQRASGGGQGGSGFGSSVPATRPNLPPLDPEADRYIGQQFEQYPEARYRITQMAVVQEAALAEAQNRIKRLEWEVSQAQAAAQQAPRGGGGLFGGLFGGGQRPQQAPPGYGQQQYQPPPPQYPPNYQPGMFQRQGSGFLGSALTTAAGVAGGMVVGDALMNMFDGHGGGLGGGGETIVENNYGNAGGDPFSGGGADTSSDPWGGGGDQGGADPFGGSGWDSGGGGDDSLF